MVHFWKYSHAIEELGNETAISPRLMTEVRILAPARCWAKNILAGPCRSAGPSPKKWIRKVVSAIISVHPTGGHAPSISFAECPDPRSAGVGCHANPKARRLTWPAQRHAGAGPC